jgi:hypothetical protein
LVDRARYLGGLDSRIRERLPEPLKGHLRVVDVRGNTLVVLASSPAWAAKARYETRTILDSIKEIAGIGPIHNVRIRTSPESPRNPGPTPKHPGLSEAAANELSRAARTISDRELGEALERISRKRR